MTANKLIYLIAAVLFINRLYAQNVPGGIKIVVEEKTKAGRKTVVNDTVKVLLNANKELVLITDAEGSVLISGLTAGVYTVTLSHANCQNIQYREVHVGEGKTAYLVMPLTCASYINSLSRKEKKKLGYN